MRKVKGNPRRKAIELLRELDQRAVLWFPKGKEKGKTPSRVYVKGFHDDKVPPINVSGGGRKGEKKAAPRGGKEISRIESG